MPVAASLPDVDQRPPCLLQGWWVPVLLKPWHGAACLGVCSFVLQQVSSPSLQSELCHFKATSPCPRSECGELFAALPKSRGWHLCQARCGRRHIPHTLGAASPAGNHAAAQHPDAAADHGAARGPHTLPPCHPYLQSLHLVTGAMQLVLLLLARIAACAAQAPPASAPAAAPLLTALAPAPAEGLPAPDNLTALQLTAELIAGFTEAYGPGEERKACTIADYCPAAFPALPPSWKPWLPCYLLEPPAQPPCHHSAP